jgi:hypothetical protein
MTLYPAETVKQSRLPGFLMRVWCNGKRENDYRLKSQTNKCWVSMINVYFVTFYHICYLFSHFYTLKCKAEILERWPRFNPIPLYKGECVCVCVSGSSWCGWLWVRDEWHNNNHLHTIHRLTPKSALWRKLRICSFLICYRMKINSWYHGVSLQHLSLY